MTTVRITEGDQLILACDISDIANQNEFIRGLVAEAQAASDGMAEREDAEGCMVTAVIGAASQIQDSQVEVDGHEIQYDNDSGYPFATDSESGTISAIDFADACQQLDAMVPAKAIEDGAFGWVEDTDGERYEIGIDE